MLFVGVTWNVSDSVKN